MTDLTRAPKLVPKLVPGATVGILGGGQLGRMLALAASPLGLRCHIYCPDADSPAFQVSDAHTVAAYDDETALAAFADAVDVVTYEFENVPEATARFLESRTVLRPGSHPLGVAQDRLSEKAVPELHRHSARPPSRPWTAPEDIAKGGRGHRPAGDPQDAAHGLRRQGPDAHREPR